MKRLGGALFDLNGTLVYSEGITQDVWTELVTGLGFKFGGFPYATIVGLSNRAAAAKVVQHFGFDIDPEQLFRRFEARFNERARHELRLRPGAKHLLTLFNSTGVRRGLVTSADAAHVDLVLSLLDLRSYFSAIVTCETEGLDRVKPDCDPYVRCADDLGVKYGECVAFEDCPIGVTSALRAGMHVVALAHAWSPVAGLRHAHIVLESGIEVQIFRLQTLLTRAPSPAK